MIRSLLVFTLLGCVAVTQLVAQESRGAISGRLLDPTGASIPGATVIIRNTETNSVSRSATNATGYFEVILLNPGLYSVEAEAKGFKRLVRTGIQLSVAGRIDLDLQLEVGDTSQTMEVTAAAPLIETTSASGGRVIDNKQLVELPFGEQNPFILQALAPGMQQTGASTATEPWSTYGTSSYNTMGAVGQNEYSIDGAPANGTYRRNAFVPPADAVEEFKLETTPFDASYGRTSGAVVNVQTKAGTNQYRGSLYYQHWQQRWNATPHFTRLAYEAQEKAGKLTPGAQKQAPGRQNTPTVTLSGPVQIPKVFNGRDKLFFMISWNGAYRTRSESAVDIVNNTVPAEAWRRGDFSNLLGIDPVRYTVYDPRSARLEGSRVVRTPFPSNQVPIWNPVYQFYESLYPLPNNVPGLVSPEGINNYYAAGVPNISTYNALINRYDYAISENHRLSGRWYWSNRHADTRDWTYSTRRGLETINLTRIAKGFAVDHVWMISPASILNVGVNASRYDEGNLTPGMVQVTPNEVGFPSYIQDRAGSYTILPALNFPVNKSIGRPYGMLGAQGANGEVKATLTNVIGRQTIKYGWQERRTWFSNAGPGYSSGQYRFDNTFLRRTDDTNTAANHALDWAAFMLGLPSSLSLDTNDSGAWTTPFRGIFVQDDIRLTSRINLNLGLRYEWEGGSTERYGRGVAGFDYNANLPFGDLAAAAYALSPIPELPAAQFRVLGGSRYLTEAGKVSRGTHHLLPRVGLAWQFRPGSVVRAGYGLYYDTFNVANTIPSQFGYTQPTATVISPDNGLSFCCGVGAASNLGPGRTILNNPFPVRADGTRFDEPYRDTLGNSAFAGRSFTFTPWEFRPASQHRWRIGVQHQVGSGMMFEISHNGSWSRIPVTQRLDFLPGQYWASGNKRDQATDDYLNQNVPNPFYLRNLAGLQQANPVVYRQLSTLGFFTNPNIRRHQLLRAFPHMTGLYGLRPGETFDSSRGATRYADLQVLFERRFSRGFHTSAFYTYARSDDRDVYLNEFDSQPSWQPNQEVRPHRFVWTAIYEIPYGQRQALMSGGLLRGLFGGWQVSWVYQRQSGPALDFPNVFFYGDVERLSDVFRHKEIHGNNIHLWFDPSIAYRGSGEIPAGFVGFEGRSALQPGQFHRRVFPTRITALRADGLQIWDAKILKNISFTERVRSALSVDLLNVTNHTNFQPPVTNPVSNNFGQVTAQNGSGRIIQLNLRVQF
jgi:hypothetical protein